MVEEVDANVNTSNSHGLIYILDSRLESGVDLIDLKLDPKPPKPNFEFLCGYFSMKYLEKTPVLNGDSVNCSIFGDFRSQDFFRFAAFSN